ncbi:synapsin [Panulirus ornatus]|uniref:synapsin n=1 Tax=Panulirus ornatus TaxID=150431 RepID=UPI003A8B2E54
MCFQLVFAYCQRCVQSVSLQPAPASSGWWQQASQSSGSPQPASLSNGSPQPAPLSSGYPQPASPSSGSPQPAPLCGRSQQPAPLSTGSPQPVPLLSGSLQPALLFNGSLPPASPSAILPTTATILGSICECSPPETGKISFSSFKASFSSNVNYLKRRFSSGDLSAECDDEDAGLRKQEVITQQAERQQASPGALQTRRQSQTQLQPQEQVKAQPKSQPHQVSSNSSSVVGGSETSAPAVPSTGAATTGSTSGFSLNFSRPGSRTTSAPSSPSKTRESFLQRVSSLTGAVRSEVTSQVRPAYNKDRCFTLLVIDDQNTDWSKYFRGKRIHGDWDIRVEQAEFRELSVTASSEGGVNVSMVVYRNGAKVVRSFKPDFVLIRQNLRDAGEDHKSLLLALKFGGVPSINSINAIYNFQDKPWVFAHLMEVQKKLGKEHFPLIEQSYFPNHKEMLSAPRYPCVFKIGHAHGGLGKIRVESNADFQDMASVVAVANTYCTTEPYIDAKFDIHIQKIGAMYKCFQRKSISGNWKTNTGSAMLEQTPMTERYKVWVDEVSSLFGGLDICAIEAIVDKSGAEHIIEVNDSALTLMGDSQEDDRRYIAELVAIKMQDACQVKGATRPAELTRGSSRQSLSGTLSSRGGSPTEDTSRLVTGETPIPGGSPSQQRRDSQVGSPTASQSSTISGFSSASGTRRQPDDSSQSSQQSASQQKAPLFGRQTSVTATTEIQSGDDADDTMKNLRKTFAGIFGDM